jgi:CMP-N-acetylneuraminic acid synthetase
MIARVIATALNARVFGQIIVSSDDDEILAVATQAGAVAYRRPEALADDMTHVGPVVEDAVRALKIKADSVCLLYATALLLQPTDLQEAFSLLLRPEVSSVLSITEFDAPIQRAYEMNSQGCIRMALPEFFNWRSQDLPKRFRDAGMFSWNKAAPLLQDTPVDTLGGAYTDRPWPQKVGYHIPKTRAVDIDTPEDLILAQALFDFYKSQASFTDGTPRDDVQA